MTMDAYLEELTRAIKRKFAPDFCTALRDATPMNLSGKVPSVRLPLRADVEVVYEKDMAAFMVTGSVLDSDKDKWMGNKSFFSTTQISSARDKVQMITYLFDEMRNELIRALVAGELKQILKEA